MKGKLLISAQLTKNSVRRDRFQVEYDEYSVNRPENRLLKTAIDNVSRLPATLNSSDNFSRYDQPLRPFHP
jgi:5-methylcytosine-specific restriction endonuclease McrBC regulatory subunit McrC